MEKKLFSREECSDIIEKAEKLNNWRNLENNIYHYQISEHTLDEYHATRIKDYCKKFLNIELDRLDASVMKYNTGDYILRHVDRFFDIESKSKYHTRMLYNVNMILNSDYTGGEFWLNGEPFIQDVGTVYHYKSDVFHEVKPITSGTRYSILYYVKESYIKRDTTLI